MAVVVVTDSSASVDPATADRLGIRVVPLHVLVGTRQLDEGVDEMPPDVTADGITTSAASPGEVRAAYTAALAASDGDGVVGVHISRQLSATWDAARAAADELGAGVRAVDSRAAALGTGFAAIAAARLAAAGAGLDAAYAAAVDVSARCQCFIVVDSLDALRRGGRISTITALLGTALVTKPLLHVEDGKLALREKVRTSSKAFARLVDTAVNVPPPPNRYWRRWGDGAGGAALWGGGPRGIGGGAVAAPDSGSARAGRHRVRADACGARRTRCGGGRGGAGRVAGVAKLSTERDWSTGQIESPARPVRPDDGSR